MKPALDNGTTDTTYPRSNGERHQVRVQTWLRLRSIWEVIPTVWPARQEQLQRTIQE